MSEVEVARVDDLEEAKRFFEEAKAQAELDWTASESNHREALKYACDALTAARRAKDVEAKMSALEIVVMCHLYLGDAFAANLAVTDELAMIKRTQDTKSEAKALQLAADVHAQRGDVIGAAEALQSAIALFKDLGDKSGQAKALRDLAMAKLSNDKKGEALAPAKASFELYQELDLDVADARYVLNTVYQELGQVDQAPDRQDALQHLKDLEEAVDNRNAAAWTKSMGALNRTGAYAQKDIDQIVARALEKDRPAASTFLQEQGVAIRAVGNGTGKPEIYMRQIDKKYHYLGLRTGGLGYGPSFRCGHQYFAEKLTTGDHLTKNSLMVLQMSDEAQDWEEALQYQPGNLDSMLQGSGYCFEP